MTYSQIITNPASIKPMTAMEARHLLENCNEEIEAGMTPELRARIIAAHDIVAAEIRDRKETYAEFRARLAGDSPADPIHDAIALRRITFAAVNVACLSTDEVAARKSGRAVTPADRAAFAQAEVAEAGALEALANCAPTTAGGLRALISYFVETAERGNVPAWLVESLLDSPVLAV